MARHQLAVDVGAKGRLRPSDDAGSEHAEVNRVLKMPEVRQSLEAMGGEVAGCSPDQMRNFVSDEAVRSRKVARDASLPKQP